MEKTLVILEVPAVSGRYEVFIPTDILVRELRELLGTSVEDLTNRRYVSSGSEILCLKERNLAMQETEYVYHYKIANGESLLLM